MAAADDRSTEADDPEAEHTEARTKDQRAAQDLDVSKPSVARVYDALLGGKNNFAVDRALAQQTLRIAPDAREAVQAHRRLLGRVVRFMTNEGLRQFLDLGSGLPTEQNTHQVAQSAAPMSRVVYVDSDPIVLSHGRALLAENDRTTVVAADIRDPKGILEHPRIRGFIDYERPLALLLAGVIHHMHDFEDPAAVVRGYIDAIPSGSLVLITHLCASGPAALAVERSYLADLGTGRFRTFEEIEAYFDGLDVVDPGVVYVPQWHPETPITEPLTTGQQTIVVGVGRKP